MNTDPKKSAQPCGCDEGANYVCRGCQDRARRVTTLMESASSCGEVAGPLSFSLNGNVVGQRTISNENPLNPCLPPFLSGLTVVGSTASPSLTLGLGGAPTRASVLPTPAVERKKFPVASGVLDYFPDALAVIANVSWRGNDQHNPGKPLHWDRSKSGDEADTLQRHFLQRGTLDDDGVRHSAKMAWRALALLQKELEQEGR